MSFCFFLSFEIARIHLVPPPIGFATAGIALDIDGHRNRHRHRHRQPYHYHHCHQLITHPSRSPFTNQSYPHSSPCSHTQPALAQPHPSHPTLLPPSGSPLPAAMPACMLTTVGALVVATAIFVAHATASTCRARSMRPFGGLPCDARGCPRVVDVPSRQSLSMAPPSPMPPSSHSSSPPPSRQPRSQHLHCHCCHGHTVVDSTAVVSTRIVAAVGRRYTSAGASRGFPTGPQGDA